VKSRILKRTKKKRIERHANTNGKSRDESINPTPKGSFRSFPEGISMKENTLLKLEAFGQSIWMDFIRRGMISSGELKQLIKENGLGGVTFNPSIFEKAIAESHDYDDARRLWLAGEYRTFQGLSHAFSHPGARVSPRERVERSETIQWPD
jgi:hypothetical protein